MNAVVNNLHKETAGNCSIVGSVAADIQSVRRREGLKGGRPQEGSMAASRCDRESTVVHLG